MGNATFLCETDSGKSARHRQQSHVCTVESGTGHSRPISLDAHELWRKGWGVMGSHRDEESRRMRNALEELAATESKQFRESYWSVV